MINRVFDKPNLVLSACLDLQPVRYNGEYVKDEVTLKLREYCNVIPICPELEIGLGIPRDKIIVYKTGSGYGLSQPSTNRELTKEMNEFSQKFLKSLKEVDGFLLKSKSPSCGVSNTSVYKDKEGTKIYGKGKGLFTMAVMDYFHDLPVEDEGRLRNPILRDLFFTNLFALAHWRNFKEKAKSIREMMEFHQSYKYLFMSRSPSYLKIMGRLLADYKQGDSFEKLKEDYEKLFKQVLTRNTTAGKHVNVLTHILGHISDFLKSEEKKHFLALLRKYKSEKISLQVLREMIISWAYRFENKYLLIQVYLNPYPEELGYL